MTLGQFTGWLILVGLVGAWGIHIHRAGLLKSALQGLAYGAGIGSLLALSIFLIGGGKP